MTPDQISKLPPELQRLEKQLRYERDELDRIYLENVGVEEIEFALTYCLQMQEERDAFAQVAKQNMDSYVNEQECRAANQTNLGIALEKLSTAEATIATLTRELEKTQEMIAILWQNGKFGMSVGNALSEDGVLKKAIAADKERKTGAALSHTPEVEKA